MFLQFRAMNSNFDVLVLSIFLGNTKFMNVLSIVPIGVLACFKYVILSFTCREVAGLNNYPGKLKLILCGFHEATVMCQYAYRIINPEKKFLLKYTTVTGVSGFDGTTKSSPKTLVKKIL